MNKHKTPVFDIGDTLFPTRKFFRESVEEATDAENFRIGNFNIFEPENAKSYFADKGVDINGEKVKQNYLRKVKTYMGEEKLELLKKCSEEFGPIGIISDNWEYAETFYTEMFEDYGIDFEGIIISEIVGVTKPDAEIFKAFLNTREKSAENFIYFGNHGDRDSAAKKVGMDFVFTTEYDNFNTTYKGRKITELTFDNVKKEVQR